MSTPGSDEPVVPSDSPPVAPESVRDGMYARYRGREFRAGLRRGLAELETRPGEQPPSDAFVPWHGVWQAKLPLSELEGLYRVRTYGSYRGAQFRVTEPRADGTVTLTAEGWTPEQPWADGLGQSDKLTVSGQVDLKEISALTYRIQEWPTGESR